MDEREDGEEGEDREDGENRGEVDERGWLGRVGRRWRWGRVRVRGAPPWWGGWGCFWVGGIGIGEGVRMVGVVYMKGDFFGGGGIWGYGMGGVTCHPSTRVATSGCWR